MPNQSTRERAEVGIFKNEDAISERSLKQFSQMLDRVLKVADKKSILPELTIPNPLPVEMGLQGKFVVWTNVVALKKPEGSGTQSQEPKLVPGVTYQLEQWEEVVTITDEAKINSQMSAQDRLNAGNAGKGFARAIDGDGLTELYSITGIAGSSWATASDDTIIDQITALQDAVEGKGYDPNKICITRKQWNRIGRFEWVTKAVSTTEVYLSATMKLQPILIKRISYEDDTGTTVVIFDPTGEVLCIDSEAYAVFSQRPTTVEFERNVSRGVDLAYMRKFFKTKAVQLGAAEKLTGVII